MINLRGNQVLVNLISLREDEIIQEFIATLFHGTILLCPLGLYFASSSDTKY